MTIPIPNKELHCRAQGVCVDRDLGLKASREQGAALRAKFFVSEIRRLLF